MLPLELPSPDVRPSYCYWKPSADFLDELAGFLKGKRVIEVFAGNGLLAGHLASRGIDITATTVYSGHDGHAEGFYHPVEDLPAREAARRYRSQADILLMCWPTVTREALIAAMLWGREIVFVGEVTDYAKEHLGGCATDEFFESMHWHHEFTSYQTRNPMERALVGELRIED